MSDFARVWPWLLAMGVLICLSALFSGSEAALFSLKQRGRKRLARSGLGGRVASRLLDDPENLLSAILFWNLLINMTYFAIAAIVGSRLESSGKSAFLLFTIASLLTIIFLSEMLPKSIAVLSPVRASVLVGPPLSVAVRVVRPVLPVVQLVNRTASRLIWPSFEPEKEIDLYDIERAVDLGTDDAILLQREQLAMRGVVEMAESRVGEFMRPRARLWVGSLSQIRDRLDAGSPPGGYYMVTDQNKKIVGAIPVRLLRPSQMDDLQSALESVVFVPWSAMVSQVWDQLDQEDLSVAVIVNEFGDMVGALSVDDILGRVLAPRRGRDLTSEQSIQQLDDHSFRVSGSASLRSLAKRLGVDLPDETTATVGGFLQKNNERRPRVGDAAMLDRFVLSVTEATETEVWIEVRPQANGETGASGES